MNKKELFNTFDQRISKTVIVHRDTEWVIQGKYCVITPTGDGRYDIWICNASDISKGLDQRKVRNIARKLFGNSSKKAFTELTGEGYGVVAGTDLILQSLELLGIRKKREVSPERVAQLNKRLTATNDPNLELGEVAQ